MNGLGIRWGYVVVRLADGAEVFRAEDSRFGGADGAHRAACTQAVMRLDWQLDATVTYAVERVCR